METVWMTLSTLEEGNEQPQSRTFMFGPTGITGFKPVNSVTVLLSGNKAIAIVTNTQEEIMKILAKMRGTEGKYDKNDNSKTKKKTKLKKASPKTKVSR